MTEPQNLEELVLENKVEFAILFPEGTDPEMIRWFNGAYATVKETELKARRDKIAAAILAAEGTPNWRTNFGGAQKALAIEVEGGPLKAIQDTAYAAADAVIELLTRTDWADLLVQPDE